MSHNMGLIIESMVAVLLAITIAHCALLNRRLKRLKADEASLKATIAELITASEIAERAIEGLKVAVRECDADLGLRLQEAERFSTEIDRQVAAGEDILRKLSRIVATRRQAGDQPPAPAPDTKAVLAAAQAFASRIRPRVRGAAA